MDDLRKAGNESVLAKYIAELEESGDLAVERAKLEIAEQLMRAMSQEGVTKAELSRRMGKSRAYITQILHGDVNFTIESLVRIALTLNCEIQTLIVSKNPLHGWIDTSYHPVHSENAVLWTDQTFVELDNAATDDQLAWAS